MKNIYFRNGVLIYYGNPAGYLSDGKVILDSIFDKGDIKEFLSEKEKLTVEVREGVYDRLSEGGGMEEVKIQGRERRIKIHQLKQGSPLMMRFISLAERENRGYGKPQAEEYALVYEGEVENFSLEEVWEKFGRRVPKDFEGHALSISDVEPLFLCRAERICRNCISIRIAGRRKGRTWQEKEQKIISRIHRAKHSPGRRNSCSRWSLMCASSQSNPVIPSKALHP